MAVHSTYEVRWKNFKGFKDTNWIKIKPITILIGSNNSGKSSFIAPLLLMNQTMSSGDRTSPLVIKGNLYDGGNFKDLSNNYNLANDIFFGFRYHVHTDLKRPRKVGNYPPGAFEVTIGKSKEGDKAIVKKETIYDLYLREYFSISKVNQSYQVEGLKLSTNEKNALKSIAPVNFLFTPNALLTQLSKIRNNDPEKVNNESRFSKGFEELLRAISRNFTDASQTILNLSYLGPIRENPKRYYQLSNEHYKTVGLKGENTPSLIKNNFDSIKKELNNWIKKFEFGDELTLNEKSDDIYSICFKDNALNTETNISNTGFGASQVLPLIIQALVSPEESLTIAEQPEIHLNPRLQGVLAELFAFMAKKDQRIIVETHSEHLLLKLRNLVADKSINPDDIAIYFVEKQKGESKIKEIKIEENGHIKPEVWPVGFFGETLKGSLELATQQAKIRKK